MPFCNSDAFQIFLKELSIHKKSEFKILILDNGAFHHAKSLQIPDNIALIFLPPYSPELNPAERMWRFIKDRMAMTAFKSIEALKMKLEVVVKSSITTKTVKSVCNDDFYCSNFKTTFNV
jgi:transposase